MRLLRDLLLRVFHRHFQLQQWVKIIWVFQNCSQSPHFFLFFLFFFFQIGSLQRG
uniref:Squalene synthase n=1 Tax=Rhizophora mucronata TaxID=61149 RepID=A0A2P2LV77_RHIMU